MACSLKDRIPVYEIGGEGATPSGPANINSRAWCNRSTPRLGRGSAVQVGRLRPYNNQWGCGVKVALETFNLQDRVRFPAAPPSSPYRKRIVGRVWFNAPVLKTGDRQVRGFESYTIHQYYGLEAEAVEAPPCHGGESGSMSRRDRQIYCGENWYSDRPHKPVPEVSITSPATKLGR